MSLRKKKKEIRRLISAFENEAARFHDISFSTYYLTQSGPVEEREFRTPNHTIILWQYYGPLGQQKGIEQFVENLEASELKWGVRGAELTSFAVFEGEKCDTFVRMAKRAGSLFNEKEAESIKLGVVRDMLSKESKNDYKPTAISNSNELAIWLNYLLHYVSVVNPGREKATRIEPDPFSLSLLALENLLEEQQIIKSNCLLSNGVGPCYPID